VPKSLISEESVASLASVLAAIRSFSFESGLPILKCSFISNLQVRGPSHFTRTMPVFRCNSTILNSVHRDDFAIGFLLTPLLSEVYTVGNQTVEENTANSQIRTTIEQDLPERPKTITECDQYVQIRRNKTFVMGTPGWACPWISCEHHMAIHVNGKGALRVNPGHQLTESPEEDVPDLILDEQKHTCSRKMPKEPQTFDAIGEQFGLTRERIRQIVRNALFKLRYLPVFADEVVKRDGDAPQATRASKYHYDKTACAASPQVGQIWKDRRSGELGVVQREPDLSEKKPFVLVRFGGAGAKSFRLGRHGLGAFAEQYRPVEVNEEVSQEMVDLSLEVQKFKTGGKAVEKKEKKKAA